jgi:2-iminobutanoate/2-iminopropanoate deaminase
MSRMSARIAILCVVVAPALAAQQPAQSGPVNAGARTVYAPGGNLSNAIRVGDMVYASGQLGLSRQNPDTTIQGQTRLALEATKRALESAGTNMENVVKCTVFLTRASDFQGMNGVYREFFPANPPARSTVVVAALVSPAAIVEIECMAVMPK